MYPFAKDGDIIRITQPPEAAAPGKDTRSQALKKRAAEGFLFTNSHAALKVLDNDQRRHALKVSIAPVADIARADLSSLEERV